MCLVAGLIMILNDNARAKQERLRRHKKHVAWTRFLCPGAFKGSRTQKTCPGY